MKRLFCFFLAFCLIAVLSWHIRPANAEDMEVTSESGIGIIPGDAFTGDGKEFTGEDGSVTTVYDNGSMRTEYPDGTSEGIDYNGNLYRSGENGMVNISCLDGSTAVMYPDSKLEHKYSDGSYEITNPDGSTVTKNSAGLVIEKDPEGNTLSFGFENGEKIEMVDGQPPEGDHAITGPNGETLTMHFDPNAEDMDLSVRFEGNGQKLEMTAKDGELDLRFSDPDGTAFDGHMDDKNIELSMKESNGDAFNLSVDSENGHMQMSCIVDGEEAIIGIKVSEDGSGSLTVKDAETDFVLTGSSDGTMDLKDNRTGAHSHYGPDGLVIKNADGTGIKMDAEGNLIWADVRDEKGNQLLSAKDGVMTFADPENPSKKLTLTKIADGGYTAITSDGDAYRVDPDGTITKNGKPFTPLESTEPGEPGNDTEHTEIGLLDEPELKGDALSASEIEGTYVLTGRWISVNSKNPDRSFDNQTELIYTFTAESDTRLKALVENAGITDTVYVTYDPDTGRGYLADADGGTATYVFSKEGDAILCQVYSFYAYDDEKGQVFISGYKD